MKSLFFAASLLASATTSLADTVTSYQCRISVYGGGEPVYSTVSFQIPGTQTIQLAGTAVKVTGSTSGRVVIRVSQKDKNFPYAVGQGSDFPSGVGAVLATAGGTASAVMCDKKD